MKFAGQNTNQSPLFSCGRVHRRRFREADRAIGRPGWASGASGVSQTSPGIMLRRKKPVLRAPSFSLARSTAQYDPVVQFAPDAAE
jgi:hypothetical protein